MAGCGSADQRPAVKPLGPVGPRCGDDGTFRTPDTDGLSREDGKLCRNV